MSTRYPNPDIEIDEGVKVSAIWRIIRFAPTQCPIHSKVVGTKEHDPLAELYYRAIKNGQPPLCCQPKQVFFKEVKNIWKPNKVTVGLLRTITKRMANVFLSSEDLVMRKLAVGTGNSPMLQSSTQLDLELFRSDPIDRFVDGDNVAVFAIIVGRLQGNGYVSHIVPDGGNSPTQLKITPGTAVNFSNGQRVRVPTINFGYNFTTVTNVDNLNDILTLSLTEPLQEYLVGMDGNEVRVSWAEAGVYGNSTATGAANSGTIFNRINDLEHAKTDSDIDLVIVRFTFEGN